MVLTFFLVAFYRNDLYINVVWIYSSTNFFYFIFVSSRFWIVSISFEGLHLKKKYIFAFSVWISLNIKWVDTVWAQAYYDLDTQVVSNSFMQQIHYTGFMYRIFHLAIAKVPTCFQPSWSRLQLQTKFYWIYLKFGSAPAAVFAK